MTNSVKTVVEVVEVEKTKVIVDFIDETTKVSIVVG